MNTATKVFLNTCLATVSFWAARAADKTPALWELGTPDGQDQEFALAPKGYTSFRHDGFYVVGQSQATRDWPYVQPGPADAWAGGGEHSYTVVFGIKDAPSTGECRLRVELVDTHRQAPPKLRISLNGQDVQQQTPPGGGDASLFGNAAAGKRHRFQVAWPASALKAGANELVITTSSGSWMIYDALSFDAPPGAELVPVSGTRVVSISAPAVLTEQNGQLRQAVVLRLHHYGEPAAAIVSAPGADPIHGMLGNEAQTFTLSVPAVQAAQELGVHVEVGGQSVVTPMVILKPVRKWVVYLLPHSHVDIGYTHVQTDVERAQWSYLETAIDTARRTASNPPGSRFKWNVEVLWAVDSYLRQASPEKQEQFVAAVKAGWVGLQALYGNELTGLCRPEELLRLVGFAQKLSQRVGKPIESAMITDVPGYTWGMVPAFAQSGVKYFSAGPNGGDRIGHTTAAWGDKPFWWIGPNSRERVLVWMTGTGYYQVFQSPEKLIAYLGQLDAKAYPYDFVQVRHCLGDNGAPDVNFADKVKVWNETHAYPRLVIATSEEMFHDFEQRYGDKIPTARGDFTPYWEDGAGSSARETALNRASADRLSQAETLFSMFNPHAYPAEEFYQAWRNVVLYDEHTWGAHNSISEPDAPFVKSQWAIKQAFALNGGQQSQRLVDAALAVRPSAAAVLNAIDVINTTASAATRLVLVPRDLSTAGDLVTTAPDRTSVVPAQRLASGDLLIQAKLQPFSTTRLYLGGGANQPPSEAAAAAGNTLYIQAAGRERKMALRIDPQTGGVASLHVDGREFVDPKAATGLNDYFYLPGTDLKGLQRTGPVRIAIKERGPLVASLVVESDAPGCRHLTREVLLHAFMNLVEIVNTVDKSPVRAKEGVHFGFGFNVPDGTVRMDVPWAVVRPEIDQIPGACRNWFTVQRWVDISNADYGVTWFTPDAPLVQIGAITANLVGSLPDPKVWMNRIEPSSILYSWAMNNHWHTNYRADQEGPTVFRYFILPHGPAAQGETAQLALDLSQPPLVVPARGPEAKLARLRLSNPNVSLTAFKPSDDGNAWIVRLFGAAGRDETLELSWAAPVPRLVSMSDATERPLKAITGPIAVPAYGIVTLRAELP